MSICKKVCTIISHSKDIIDQSWVSTVFLSARPPHAMRNAISLHKTTYNRFLSYVHINQMMGDQWMPLVVRLSQHWSLVGDWFCKSRTALWVSKGRPCKLLLPESIQMEIFTHERFQMDRSILILMNINNLYGGSAANGDIWGSIVRSASLSLFKHNFSKNDHFSFGKKAIILLQGWEY